MGRRKKYHGPTHYVEAAWPQPIYELLIRIGGVYRARFGIALNIADAAMVAVLMEAQRAGLRIREDAFEAFNYIPPGLLQLPTGPSVTGEQKTLDGN